MAVPKKRKSKTKKRNHLAVFFDNFKKLANKKNSIIRDILKKKFSNNCLIMKNKNYIKLFNKI